MVQARSPFVPALALVLLASACNVSQHQGRPFAEAFPDPSVLVTTTDPASVRGRLDTASLPDTREHHDLLLGLLRSRDRLHAAHVALLTRAVATPSNAIRIVNGQRLWSYGLRGDGEPARVIDQILDEGIDRIAEIDRESFGQLVGMTQSDATMRRYCDRFLRQLDDGSPAALVQILDAMHGSPAMKSFLTTHIAPNGGLAGERGWQAFELMAFDSDRATLLGLVLPQNTPIDGDRMVRVMRKFSFDSGRQEAFAMLVPHVKPLEADAMRTAVATFSFDSGRQAAMATIGRQRDVQLTDELLVTMVRLNSFDSGKLDCVKALAGRLHGAPDGRAAKALLSAFSFDSGRLDATRVMAKRWLELPTEDRRSLLATFSFSSNREDATRLLMK